MFFEGFRSERQLIRTVNVNLAHRRYIGYDLGEAVPDHSSLSKIRGLAMPTERYGPREFQHFFEKVVELCQEAGLVWGKELYFDGSKIRANAAIHRLIPRRLTQASEHVNVLFAAGAPTEEANPPPEELAGLVHKYDGTQRTEKGTPSYARTRMHRSVPPTRTLPPCAAFRARGRT